MPGVYRDLERRRSDCLHVTETEIKRQAVIFRVETFYLSSHIGEYGGKREVFLLVIIVYAEIGTQAAVSYMHYIGSGNFGGARFGMPAGERGAWAAGIRYLNYGAFDGYMPDGTATGSFTPTDIVKRSDGEYCRPNTRCLNRSEKKPDFISCLFSVSFLSCE